MKDYYKILGVPYNASRKTIQSAYRQAVKKYHPDVARTGDHERFIEVREAYEVLGNPERRRGYDREMAVSARDRRWDETSYIETRRSSSPIRYRSGYVVTAELVLSPDEAYGGGIFTITVPFSLLCPSCSKFWCISEDCWRCCGHEEMQRFVVVTVKVPPRTIPGTVILHRCVDPWGRAVQLEFFCRVQSLR